MSSHKPLTKCKNADAYKAVRPPRCKCDMCKIKWEFETLRRATGSLRDDISLRDWFAGQALCAYYMGDYSPEETGRVAYEIADSMLKAREEAK